MSIPGWLMSFISELKRRNVFRMAALYLISAWLIMQVTEVIIGLASLPDWLGIAVLSMLALGFPVALVLSWFYEVTPEGIGLEKDADSSQSITRITGRRPDIVVIALLAAAVMLFAIDKWWASGPSHNSIAVLAFANMSENEGDEYFSDGVSEELLNLLAQVPELRVISRSSAFSYKGKKVAIPTISEQLNVAHVLEGSVRKFGDRVRITAQLIDANTDTHVWSQTYDRKLDDIFATQDEIAKAVVQQLKIKLLDDVPTRKAVDPDAYALFLQAKYLRHRSTAEATEKSIALYEEALRIDPDYAEAWAGLSADYISQADQGLRPSDEGFALAREAANKALEFDPDSAAAHSRMARIAMTYDRDLAAAALHYSRALASEPGNAGAYSNAATLAAFLGRLEQAIELKQYAVARDPVSPRNRVSLGLFYLNAGQPDAAIEAFNRALTLSPGYFGAHYQIGTAMLLKGEPEAALAAFEEERSSAWKLIGTVMAYHALGRESDSDSALGKLVATYERDAAYNIAYVYAFRNEPDNAFDWLDKAVANNDPGLGNIGIHALFGNIRTDPRWIPFLERSGLAPSQLADIEFDVRPPDRT